MSLILNPHPYIIENMRQAALTNGWAGGAREAAEKTLEGVFGGKAAYILLEPAPPKETIEAIREEVNKILNREKGLIYVPKPGDLIR